MCCQKAPGAAEAGLDFIENEEGAVFSAELLRAFKIPGGWQDDACFTLNGLEDEGCVTLGGQLLFQLREVTEVDKFDTWDHFAEAIGPKTRVHQSQRAAGKSVKCAARREQSTAFGMSSGKLDCGFYAVGA